MRGCWQLFALLCLAVVEANVRFRKHLTDTRSHSLVLQQQPVVEQQQQQTEDEEEGEVSAMKAPPRQPFFKENPKWRMPKWRHSKFSTVIITDFVEDEYDLDEIFVPAYGMPNLLIKWEPHTHSFESLLDTNEDFNTIEDSFGHSVGAVACDVVGDDGQEELFLINSSLEPGQKEGPSFNFAAVNSDRLFQMLPEGKWIDLLAGKQVLQTATRGAAACVDRQGLGRYGIFVAPHGGSNVLLEWSTNAQQLHNVAKETNISEPKNLLAESVLVAPFRSDTMQANSDILVGTRGVNSNFVYRHDQHFGDSYTMHNTKSQNKSQIGAWVSAVIDLDHDDNFDLVIASGDIQADATLQILLNVEDGFVDATPDVMKEVRCRVADIVVADFDNNGEQDVFVLTKATSMQQQPNYLFLRDKLGQWWLEHIGDAEERNRVGASATSADLDNDGRLELVTVSGSPLTTDAVSIYWAPYSFNHWIRVKPLTRHGAPARGSFVKAVTTDGTQVRTIACGGRNEGQPDAHFGFGPRTTLFYVYVRWPDGAVTNVTAPGVDKIVEVDYPVDFKTSETERTVQGTVGEQQQQAQESRPSEDEICNLDCMKNKRLARNRLAEERTAESVRKEKDRNANWFRANNTAATAEEQSSQQQQEATPSNGTIPVIPAASNASNASNTTKDNSLASANYSVRMDMQRVRVMQCMSWRTFTRLKCLQMEYPLRWEVFSSLRLNDIIKKPTPPDAWEAAGAAARRQLSISADSEDMEVNGNPDRSSFGNSEVVNTTMEKSVFKNMQEAQIASIRSNQSWSMAFYAALAGFIFGWITGQVFTQLKPAKTDYGQNSRLYQIQMAIRKGVKPAIQGAIFGMLIGAWIGYISPPPKTTMDAYDTTDTLTDADVPGDSMDYNNAMESLSGPTLEGGTGERWSKISDDEFRSEYHIMEISATETAQCLMEHRYATLLCDSQWRFFHGRPQYGAQSNLGKGLNNISANQSNVSAPQGVKLNMSLNITRSNNSTLNRSLSPFASPTATPVASTLTAAATPMPERSWPSKHDLVHCGDKNSKNTCWGAYSECKYDKVRGWHCECLPGYNQDGLDPSCIHVPSIHLQA